MARQTMRKDMRRLFKRLDDDDRERVLKFAERLADSDASKSAESLAEDSNLPSYTAAADEGAYERKKARKEHQERVYGQG